jgi:hypothetical protein
VFVPFDDLSSFLNLGFNVGESQMRRDANYLPSVISIQQSFLGLERLVLVFVDSGSDLTTLGGLRGMNICLLDFSEYFILS